MRGCACVVSVVSGSVYTHLQACRPPSGASAQTSRRTQHGPQPGGERQGTRGQRRERDSGEEKNISRISISRFLGGKLLQYAPPRAYAAKLQTTYAHRESTERELIYKT